MDPPHVGDLKIVDRVLFTKMTVVQDFKKMEAMWGSGAEQPEVKKMWMEKVPHKGGEHKGPQQEGSHDNVVADDPASHYEEDAQTGPSDVQRAVSGGEDPTELSEYEKRRERDGKERKRTT